MTLHRFQAQGANSRGARTLLFFFTCAVALAGCASAAMKPDAASNAPKAPSIEGMDGKASGDSIHSGDTRGQIERWWAEIEGARQRAGLPPELDGNMAERMSEASMDEARAVCERPDDPTVLCRDVCQLADSICDNAENICRLAGELDNDTWATNKCRQARTSCAEAGERCCGC